MSSLSEHTAQVSARDNEFLFIAYEILATTLPFQSLMELPSKTYTGLSWLLGFDVYRKIKQNL